MATERRRRGALAALLAAVAALLTPATSQAAAPWWQFVALAGTRVEAVAAAGRTVVVATQSQVLTSSDGGATFQSASAATATSIGPSRSVTSDGVTWAIRSDGRVMRRAAQTGGFIIDRTAPDLGAGAHLVAAPALYPGVVVAVAADGTVWRRAQDGGWAECLLLLPAGFPHGVPHVTSLAAFTQPVAGAVYLGTDGYGVLLSTDGGDDWIRAGPGLPASVLALAADAGTHELFAGTADGLWVHVLQPLPRPVSYQDAELLWRWVGIVAVSLAGAAAAAAALIAGLRRTA